ncbi:hypothetical protein KIH23_05370 [Flavobacterium sp. CYK-55]|uniref:hypothetical protein n=1 Tax=Flavobacterium sp. CYK-55 TaxID=2835529 RepID=UPI001BCB499A|nr:hypothetical protein [Flavobacterium sp. CYK-55]MBS7786718.1 hypothetical protein [Flavobacterium sp. CYK-55]
MKTRQVALILYLIACSLSVLASIIDNELLMLISKPAIIPAIIYYYLTIKKSSVEPVYIAVLLFNFVGDTIALLRFENQTLLLMIPFFMSYVLILRCIIIDVLKLKWDRTGGFIAVAIFLFLMYVLSELIGMFADTNPELVWPVIIYGIFLGGLSSLSVYCYATKISVHAFFMLMFVLTSVVSDVFYMLFEFIYKISFLNYFEFAAQLFSYYFLVKYFVLRSK